MNGTNTCDRCDEEYDNYLVLIRDNFSDIADYATEEYDNLCKPCRAFLYPRQAFAGSSDVEPKEEINDSDS